MNVNMFYCYLKCAIMQRDTLASGSRLQDTHPSANLPPHGISPLSQPNLLPHRNNLYPQIYKPSSCLYPLGCSNR